MEDALATGVVGFGTYIESSGPGQSAAQLRARIGPMALEDLRKKWSGKLTTPETTVADVQAALGSPDTSLPSILGYRLPVRTGYLYVFEFDTAKGILKESGYRRDSEVAGPRTADLAAYKQRLIELGATSAEVRSWLGEANEKYGWWPEEIWEYSSGLVLRLRHGVVEDDRA